MNGKTFIAKSKNRAVIITENKQIVIVKIPLYPLNPTTFTRKKFYSQTSTHPSICNPSTQFITINPTTNTARTTTKNTPKSNKNVVPQ